MNGLPHPPPLHRNAIAISLVATFGAAEERRARRRREDASRAKGGRGREGEESDDDDNEEDDDQREARAVHQEAGPSQRDAEREDWRRPAGRKAAGRDTATADGQPLKQLSLDFGARLSPAAPRARRAPSRIAPGLREGA